VKVAWALPCKHLDALTDGSFVAVGVISDVRILQQLPQPVGVPLLVNITGSVHDIPGEHRLSVVVTNPEMEPVTDALEAGFRVTPNPNALPGGGGNTIIPMQVVFPAATYGGYTIDIKVDDEPPHSTPIIVRAPAG
jgi:hypothetical protein